jgi:hypothetical protein
MSRAVAARPRRAQRSSRSSILSSSRNALLNYFKQSERPLQSLVFLLPLILIHEIGWRFSKSRVLAFYLLHEFLAFFGATGTLLPAMALVGILLAWHIVRHDKWTIQVNTVIFMYMESILLALPLLVLAAAVARFHLPPLLAGGVERFPSQIIISMGAGIYEELVFRLIGMTALHVLFFDILRIKRTWAMLLMVLVSSLAFSFYHYLGPEQFVWKTCLFRTVAGIYFGTIFLCRGFGVTAGSHAAYDMILCAVTGSV